MHNFIHTHYNVARSLPLIELNPDFEPVFNIHINTFYVELSLKEKINISLLSLKFNVIKTFPPCSYVFFLLSSCPKTEN